MFGILSLIIWALVLIVTVKYVLILLRADNKGEGGTLALMALASRALAGGAGTIILLGVISGALFYGDAIITPALSVLSAVEGLKVATPAFDEVVVPITVLILIVLFSMQARGTARVGTFFGPVMMIWFAAIAVGGLLNVAQNPKVFFAINPWYAVEFLFNHGLVAFYTLGAVFLVLTGCEALYADLGHFGRVPIRFAWLTMVLPALTINYLGQGAAVLNNPQVIESPFFLLYPHWALMPMVILATVATVIASQAVISGAYSLTRQAIQLGLLPRLEIVHTSEALFGQIFMPRVNTLLLIGVLLLVAMFRSSSALASAYGIAVSGTMVVTAMMAFVVIWRVWNWSKWSAAALIVPFLFIDLSFLSANMLKVIEGGWVPLALGGVVMAVMCTWRRGTRLLFEKTRRQEMPLQSLVNKLEKSRRISCRAPPSSSPATPNSRRPRCCTASSITKCCTRRTLSSPSGPPICHACRRRSASRSRRPRRISRASSCNSGSWRRRTCPRRWRLPASSAGSSTSCRRSFLSRRSLRVGCAKSDMPRWQDRLFIGLSRIANDATDDFQVPTGRVVEVGTQVAL